MKDTIKKSLSVFWRFLFANFVCIFIIIMVSTLATSLFTKEIGYDAYGVKEGGTENEFLYTYYSEDGEDTQKTKFEELGYTVSTSQIRDSMSNGERTVFLVLTLIGTLWLTGTFIYGISWIYGNKDSNKVHFGRIKEDKWRGAKIGLLATIPYFLLFIVFLICGLGVYEKASAIIYKFANCYAFGFIDMICGSDYTAGMLSWWKFVLLFALLFIPAIICELGYWLGYKDISISEKIVYKNKKKSK